MFTLTLQISKLTKAVILNSFPLEQIWQFVNEENVRCTRLMRRSFVTSCNTTKARALDVIVPAHPPILMPKEFQSLVYICIFLGE